MREDFFTVDDTGDTVTIPDTVNGGVTQVTASVTIAGKPFGGDAYIKLEEVYTFTTPVDAATALIKRDEMSDILRDQGIAQAQGTADAIRNHLSETSASRGVVAVPVVQSAASSGAQFGKQATMNVANGGPVPVTGGLQWGSIKSKFGDGDLRYITTASQSPDELKTLLLNELKVKGLNPEALTVWDNRTGPRGLEAGVPAGCVAAVKVSKEAQEFVPLEIQTAAIARAKHNADGSLYIWLTKEGESALKFGALDRIKL